MQQRKALGKGLASLIPEEKEVTVPPQMKSATVETPREIPVDSIIPNRLQPRKKFTEESLEELAKSIRASGIIQPLIVTPPVSGRYELIAGERRLRAARLAGLDKVPVVVKEADTEEMLEWAIIENVQREDLNPIDEAKAYKEFMVTFSYTQEEVADKVGKSRPHVANTLRLLQLPSVIQEDVLLGRLTPGHARALLGVTSLQEQLILREKILQTKMNVRDLEKLIQNSAGRKKKKNLQGVKKMELTPQMKEVLNELTGALGTKVNLEPAGNGKAGKVIIEYYSVQDLNRIYKKIIAQQ